VHLEGGADSEGHADEYQTDHTIRELLESKRKSRLS
jgi:hypothetical protein